MLELIIKNVFPILLLVIIFISGIAILLFLVYVLLLKLLPLFPKIKKLSTPAGSIELSEEKEIQSPPPTSSQTYMVKNPHSKCLHGKDYVILSNEEKAMIRKVALLEDSIIKEQMKLVERSVLTITNNVQELFTEKITIFMAPPYNILEHMDSREFTLCLDKMKNLIKHIIRSKCKDDKLDKKETYEYEKYIEGSIEDIFTEVKIMFDHYYMGSLVSRTSVEKIFIELEKKHTEILQELFEELRFTAIRIHEEIKKLEDDYHLFFIEMF
jgi:hypothetical protein